MNPRTPYGRRMVYPHMKPQDVAIWERFMTLNPEAYKECIYDQAVGEGANIPEGTQENIARDFKILTQWKIDVIGFAPGLIHVIEIKPRAGISTIGQVQGYAALWDDIDDMPEPVTPVIVTDELRPDMQRLCDAAGVKLFVV